MLRLHVSYVGIPQGFNLHYQYCGPRFFADIVIVYGTSKILCAMIQGLNLLSLKPQITLPLWPEACAQELDLQSKMTKKLDIGTFLLAEVACERMRVWELGHDMGFRV